MKRAEDQEDLCLPTGTGLLFFVLSSRGVDVRKGMGRMILSKAGQLILSLFVLSIVTFLISRLAPGNPLRAFYGDALEKMNPQQLATATEKLGLNDPLPTQYIRWLQQAIHGDFGISYQYRQPVTQVIAQVGGNTFLLTAVSFILIFALGLLAAIVCVEHEGRWLDRWIQRVGVAAGSIPEFFMAMLMILIFASGLSMLPMSGAFSVGGGGAADRAVHLILPAATLIITHFWYCAYLMRSRLSEEVSKDYVVLCKGKGMTQRQVIYRHCIRNIMPSAISIMAIFLPHLLGGAYVVEMVFSYPGLGKLGVESAQYHDYNMLMLVALITGAVVILANIIAQLINEGLDPRIREERGQML